MKLVCIIFLVLFSLPSWSETFDDLVKRNGLYYKKFTDVPFTGKLTGQFQGSFKKGRPEDFCQQEWDDLIAYHDHGQLIAKSDFKNGKMEDSWVEYWNNGQLWDKGDYKNGKEEDYHFMFFPDGRLAERSHYKNGLKISD